jgi:hypothetical protein
MQNWISFKKKYPRLLEDILIIINKGFIVRGMLHEYENLFIRELNTFVHMKNTTYKPLYWLYIPELPKKLLAEMEKTCKHI